VDILCRFVCALTFKKNLCVLLHFLKLEGPADMNTKGECARKFQNLVSSTIVHAAG